MSDLPTALADNSALQPFDGRDVLKATIAITNAGDGLSEALAVEPKEYHLGDRVYVVLETTVDKVRFADAGKDGDGLIRLHTLKAGRATIVSGDVVRDVLDEQQQRIERARGILQLPLDPDDGEPPLADDEDDEGDVIPIGGTR